MKTCLQITGYTDSHPGYDGKKTRKEYNCFVEYDDIEANRPVIASYLKYYCSHDPDKDPDFSYQFFNDYNCCRALITYYFRDSFQRFEVKSTDFISKKVLPDRPPDKEDKNHKIWVVEVSSNELDTSKSAAKFLFDLCSNQKLPTDLAQSVVRKNFPGNVFSWQEVLSTFCEMGGAYTKKYLRRR